MIKILTDSVASIPADVAREAGIDVVTLFVNREGCEYADSEMDLDAFYADIYDMVDNIPTSSQPSQHTLEAVFEEAARAGDEVLGIFISSELSGTYEGAVRAARAVKARNIDFTYVIVDSTSCGYDEAWPVFDAVAARDAGEDLAGCAAAALRGIESTRFLFTPETLTFLQRGGPIRNAAAPPGHPLPLSPVPTVSAGTAATKVSYSEMAPLLSCPATSSALLSTTRALMALAWAIATNRSTRPIEKAGCNGSTITSSSTLAAMAWLMI